MEKKAAPVDRRSSIYRKTETALKYYLEGREMKLLREATEELFDLPKQVVASVPTP